MYLIDKGYRKYGDEGVELIKHYCVQHIDNNNTQFLRYLAERSDKERKNLFKVQPTTLKQDGSEVTQLEADHLNTTIPSDYFSIAYFSR